MSIIMMLSVLMPTASQVAKAAPKTITGTCQVKMTKGIDWDNGATGISQFNVTMPNGKVYKAHCLDPGNPTPKDGTYKFTGTLNSSGTYDIVINSGKTTSDLDDIHPWDQDHIKHGGPPWILQNIGGFTYSPVTYGDLAIQKKSGNPSITNGNDCYSLQGAVYGIYRDGSLVKKLTLNASGFAKATDLEVDTYQVKEITAPKGYALDKKTYTITVKEDQTVTVTSTDMPQNDPAGVLLQKFDSETGESIPQGDGSLAGAEYTVKYYNDLYDSLEELDGIEPTRTWVYKTNDRGIISLQNQAAVVSGDEFYYSSDGYITFPLGTVTIQETKAPKGYFINDEIYLRQITPEGTAERVNSYNKPTDDTAQSEKVKKMKVHIFKTGTEESGQMPGLEGAEFTMKLESQVQAAYDAGYTYAEVWKGIDENGNPQSGISSARIAAAQAIAPDMAVVTTDANGDAYTEGLPYGTYLGKETKTPKNYESAGDFKFTVSKDESEVTVENKYINIYLNDKPMKAQVKMVKKDADSDKVVSLNSATFKIVALEDIYDRSTGELMFAKGDTIKQKVAGQWHSEFTTNSKNEVGTFAGEDGTIFTPLPLEPGKYQVEEIKTPEGFLNLEAPVKFEIDNIRDYTQDEDGEYMIEVVVKNEQPKGKITLEKTIEEIEDADFALIDKNADMSGIKFGLYAAEDIIDMADGEVKYDKGDLVGEYNLSKDGKLTIEGLWIGDYQLKELETLDGLVLDDTVYDISITKTDNTTKVISVAKEVVNKTTRTEITKTDVTGDKELAGAKLTVTDKETGKEVVTWTSTDEPYVIAGLVEGKTYVLTEVVAPDGYVLSASSVEFTVKEDGTTTTAEMKDKYVEVVKNDVNGKAVEGAEFTVFDKDGEVVDSWTTGTEPHKVTGLTEGETYTLEEVYAPDGYVKAKPVTIEVTKDKENQTYTVTNKQVEFIKTDVDGNQLTGMEYIVTHDKTKQIVDRGVTNAKMRTFLNGLMVGETYTLTEVTQPSGYAKKAEPLTFTVTDDNELQIVSLENKYVEVIKEDPAGDIVYGAELSVFDKETGEAVDNWTVTKEDPAHKIVGLTEGKTYILTEQYAPDGYVIATDIEFTVNDNENQTIKMVDKQVAFAKVDTDGKLIAGMEYTVTSDKTKQIVDKGITNADEVVYLNGLVAGQTYTLTETGTPDGFATAVPITFTVGDDDRLQTVTLANKTVTFVKDNNKGDTLNGGKFALYDNEGNEMYQFTSIEEGVVLTGLSENESYSVKELEAPKGHDLNSKAVNFTVSTNTDDPADKEDQIVTMTDRVTVTKTSDDTALGLMLIALMLSAGGLTALGIRRRENH